MVDYGINSTFSQDESVEYSLSSPSPFPERRNRRGGTFSDETLRDEEEETYDGTLHHDHDLELDNDNDNEFEDLEYPGNDYELEHTLSEHVNTAGPYETYRDEDDGSEMQSGNGSESEIIQKQSRSSPFRSKRNLLGLLAMILLVIVAALGGVARSRSKSASNNGETVVAAAQSAISEGSSVVVEEPSACLSIFDIVCSTPGLEFLCGLLDQACTTPGLENVCDSIGSLGGDGPFTVFAPNNDAFNALPDEIVEAIGDAMVLSDVLLYHAVLGKVLAEDLVCNASVTMANGLDTTTLCKSNDFYQFGVGNAADALPKIVAADEIACNGVVHMVDKVILPGIETVKPLEDKEEEIVVEEEEIDVVEVEEEPDSEEVMPVEIGDEFFHHGFTGQNSGSGGSYNPHQNIGASLPGQNIASSLPGQSVGVGGGNDVYHHGQQHQNSGGACVDEIHVSKPCYLPGESIQVTYKFCSPATNNWLGVFSQGASDRFGKIRQKPVYWELPCGGHGESCATPSPYGSLTLNAMVSPGRYQVHSIGSTSRPFVSMSTSTAFGVGKRCEARQQKQQQKQQQKKGKSPHYNR